MLRSRVWLSHSLNFNRHSCMVFPSQKSKLWFEKQRRDPPTRCAMSSSRNDSLRCISKTKGLSNSRPGGRQPWRVHLFRHLDGAAFQQLMVRRWMKASLSDFSSCSCLSAAVFILMGNPWSHNYKVSYLTTRDASLKVLKVPHQELHPETCCGEC